MSDAADFVDADVPRIHSIADSINLRVTDVEDFKTLVMDVGNRLGMGVEAWGAAKIAIELRDELRATATVLRTRATIATRADNGESFEGLQLAFSSQIVALRSGLDDGVGASGDAADRLAQVQRITFPEGVPTQHPYDRRSREEWEAEVLTGPVLAAAGPFEAFRYWSALTDEQKIAAFKFSKEQVEQHYVRMGVDVPVGVRYSPNGAVVLEQVLGGATPRSQGDAGFNLVTDSPQWMQDAARWWIQRNHEGDAWDAPQVDGLYVQDMPLWLIATWLGPEASVDAAVAAVGGLPAAPDAFSYGEDPPHPYDRYSGHGERVLPVHEDGVLLLAEFFAYSADGSTIVTSVPLGVPGVSDVFTAGVSLLATAYTLADFDYDPNVKVDPENSWTDLSGAPVWPPSLGSNG